MLTTVVIGREYTLQLNLCPVWWNVWSPRIHSAVVVIDTCAVYLIWWTYWKNVCQCFWKKKNFFFLIRHLEWNCILSPFPAAYCTVCIYVCTACRWRTLLCFCACTVQHLCLTQKKRKKRRLWCVKSVEFPSKGNFDHHGETKPSRAVRKQERKQCTVLLRPSVTLTHRSTGEQRGEFPRLTFKKQEKSVTVSDAVLQ